MRKPDALGGMAIHPTAIVDPTATLGNDVSIGPYSIVEADVVIGEGTRLANNVRICRWTRLGAKCRIESNAVIGGDPQYVGWDCSQQTGVLIGDRCTLREAATVHRSIYEGKNTVIGNDVYLMVNAHVAHDCVLGDRVVLTNNAMIAGHAEIGANAYIGGGAAVHQFVRVGEGSMTGGVSRIVQDVAPYLIVAERGEVHGLNLVGLKRRGTSREVIKELKELFHLLLDTPGNIKNQAAEILEQRGASLSEQGRCFVEFFQTGKRGFSGLERKSGKSGTADS
ncbi:MAG: acyl-ACP--UDP-N-acetylglucosamine O-acyltransferase [Puniceicoccaceae bacterium]